MRRGIRISAVAVCVALLSSCSLVTRDPSTRLGKQINEVDGVTQATLVERRVEGVGDRYLDLTVTFDDQLATDDLGRAIDEVYSIAESSDIPLTRNELHFGSGSYDAERGLLDPATGILEMVAGLPTHALTPLEIAEGTNRAARYGVKVTSPADDLPGFRADVDQLLQVQTAGNAVLVHAAVEAPGQGFMAAGHYSVDLATAPDQHTAALLESSFSVSDPGVLGLQFFALEPSTAQVRVITDGRPESVMGWLRTLAAQSPLQVTIEACEPGMPAWFSEIG